MYIYDNISPNSPYNDVSHNLFTEKNTHILRAMTFSENRAVYEIMWKKFCTDGEATDNTRRTRSASWITKDTNTHSEYVILIACPLQQWLLERASMLRYTYNACLLL